MEEDINEQRSGIKMARNRGWINQYDRQVTEGVAIADDVVY